MSVMTSQFIRTFPSSSTLSSDAKHPANSVSCWDWISWCCVRVVVHWERCILCIPSKSCSGLDYAHNKSGNVYLPKHCAMLTVCPYPPLTDLYMLCYIHFFFVFTKPSGSLIYEYRELYRGNVALSKDSSCDNTNKYTTSIVPHFFVDIVNSSLRELTHSFCLVDKGHSSSLSTF